VQGASTLASGGQHALGQAGVELGNDAGTAGNINVVGAGSTLNANGDRITVGRAGGGILTVAGGARAISGAAYADTEAALALGGLAGGAGTVNVQGAGSQLLASGAAVLGGNNSGAGVTAGGTGTLNVTSGGAAVTGAMAIFGGSALNVDATSTASVVGDLVDIGSVTTSGALLVTGNVAGGGTLNVSGGVADLAGLGVLSVNMSGPASVLRVHSLTGGSVINGMQFGEAIDLAGITGATLSGNTVTAGGGSITLGAAPSGYNYKLYGDANGGTDILLNPASPPPAAISITDASAGNAASNASGQDYNGPVDYLQRQYIWPGNATDNLAIRANVPNAFLKGGAGSDALQADYGNNVLDGGAGSNFLIGGNGADGGRDTFFVDARDPSQITWSTIVGFHKGDQATIFGFHANLSTMPITGPEGVDPYKGATIHSEINGPGTGIDASITFAGIDVATAQHFTYSTAPAGSPVDYLLFQYL
jgi:serralysin